MRTRTLSASEANCYRTYIDDYYTENLIVLNLYDNGLTPAANRGYYVYSFAYANLASTFQVVPPTIPAYISFATPSGTVSKDPSSFQWVFRGANSATVIRQDNNNANHYNSQTISGLPTGYSIESTSKSCLIIKSSLTYTLYDFTGATFTSISITSQVGNNPQALSVSDDCSRLRVNNNIFARVGATYQVAASSIASITALDQNFAYVLADNSIWKYTSSANTYSKSFGDANTTFASGSSILSFNGRIITALLTANSASFRLFSDNGTSINSLPAI